MDAKGTHFSTLGSCTLFSQDSPRKTDTIQGGTLYWRLSHLKTQTE